MVAETIRLRIYSSSIAIRKIQGWYLSEDIFPPDLKGVEKTLRLENGKLFGLRQAGVGRVAVHPPPDIPEG